jgi:hypothetical protein
LPSDVRNLLVPGRIRDLDDITDLTTAMIRAFAEGDIHPGRSKEIRQWTHLLFTAVAAKNPKQDAPVNLITQLIQMETPILQNPRVVVPGTATSVEPAPASPGPEPQKLFGSPDHLHDLTKPSSSMILDIDVLEIE